MNWRKSDYGHGVALGYLWRKLVPCAVALLIPTVVAVAQEIVAEDTDVDIADGGIYQFERGQAYDYGIGEELDNDEAARWYRLAIEEGHVEASFRLGLLYFHRQIALPAGADRLTLTRSLYEQAALGGFRKAQVALAELYFQDLNIVENRHLAYYWFEQAARGGSPIAQIRLATMHLDGIGAPQNLLRATIWYEIFLANSDSDTVQVIFNEQLQHKFDNILIQLPTNFLRLVNQEVLQIRQQFAASQGISAQEVELQ